MTKNLPKFLAAAAALAIAVTGSIAGAALLGNAIGFPRIVFQSGNANITSGLVQITSAPVILQVEPIVAPVFINPVPSAYETFNLEFSVDSSCNLAGGAAGDDLFIFGEVDLGGDLRSGTLLVGEVTDFGSLDAGSTDLFELRVEVTGGALADLYTDHDLGIIVQSENSSFSGDCSQDSTGEAKGTLGSTDPILPANGCTPGYWKQKHHFDSWVNYESTDLFFDVFGRNVDDVTDLVSALKAKGGGVKALARHATASLLNVANGGVNVTAYTTEAEVIAAFQAAFDSGDYELQKNAFEEVNEAGCPLN